MELQPGQVNWGGINPQLIPGTVKMWIMQAFAGKCSFLSTYRFRHPLASSEMYHEGIISNDGISLTQGGTEFVESIELIRLLRTKFDQKIVSPPSSLSLRKTAIIWNHSVMWDLDIQPQTRVSQFFYLIFSLLYFLFF